MMFATSRSNGCNRRLSSKVRTRNQPNYSQGREEICLTSYLVTTSMRLDAQFLFNALVMASTCLEQERFLLRYSTVGLSFVLEVALWLSRSSSAHMLSKKCERKSIRRTRRQQPLPDCLHLAAHHEQELKVISLSWLSPIQGCRGRRVKRNSRRAN